MAKFYLENFWIIFDPALTPPSDADYLKWCFSVSFYPISMRFSPVKPREFQFSDSRTGLDKKPVYEPVFLKRSLFWDFFGGFGGGSSEVIS